MSAKFLAKLKELECRVATAEAQIAELKAQSETLKPLKRKPGRPPKQPVING